MTEGGVWPLSFSEVLRLYGIQDRLGLFAHKARILQLVDELMHYGSFHEVLTEPEHKRDIILGYYDTLLLKNCIANRGLRDAKGFQALAHFAISNSGNLFSYNSMARALESNDNSVKEYLSALEDSYILSEIRPFSWSLKEQLRVRKKLYLNDNSFLAQTSFRFSKDLGRLFENLVHTELIKQGREIFFYNKDFECDFITRRDGILEAFQVCHELSPQNLQRELRGLEKLPIPCEHKHLILYDKPLFDFEATDIQVHSFFEFFSFPMRKKE